MSILTKIFSGSATDLVEGVGGVLDNLTTSKEEKLEAKRKMKKHLLDRRQMFLNMPHRQSLLPNLHLRKHPYLSDFICVM